MSHQNTRTCLRKESFKRETESLLIAAQNNVKKANYVKAKIGKTQQNRKCKLCNDGERNDQLYNE